MKEIEIKKKSRKQANCKNGKKDKFLLYDGFLFVMFQTMSTKQINIVSVKKKSNIIVECLFVSQSMERLFSFFEMKEICTYVQ